MEDDVVVVAALGEGGEVGASLEKSKSVPGCKRIRRLEFRGSRIKLAYLGGMVVVEFEGYRALRKVSKWC